MDLTGVFAKITAIGTYVPERALTNADLEQMVETSDEWIVKRTGIRERRIAAPDQYTSHLAIAAVNNLMERYGKKVTDVDFIVVCTHTPDFPFPSVSCLIQDHFHIEHCGAIDLNATCAGFTYGLHMANSLISSGLHRKVLVIAADTISKITDYTDRTTCILLGDGAGAVLVEASNESGFLAHDLGAEGEGGIHVYRTGLSNTMGDVALNDSGCFVQNGREVYRWAVTTVPQGMHRLMETSGLTPNRIDWFVPHSANLRIIESICEKSGYPYDKTLYNLVHQGNTSAATIPLAIDLGIREGRVKPGDTMMLYGFGGGLVYAGLIIKWLAYE